MRDLEPQIRRCDRPGACLPRHAHLPRPLRHALAMRRMRRSWKSGSDTWRANILELGKCENVMVKLAGLRCIIARCLRKGQRRQKLRRARTLVERPTSRPASSVRHAARDVRKQTTPSIAGARPTPVLVEHLQTESPPVQARMRKRRLCGERERFYRVEDLLA
jgi:hypothetical protein